MPFPFPTSISIIPEEDELPDSFMTVSRYVGGTNPFGEVMIGVNDEDLVQYFHSSVAIAEGTALSMHDDNNADYLNNSGQDAIAVLVISAVNTGGATRHVKIYSSNTTDTTSVNLLWEFGQQDTTTFDGSGDLMTTPPLRVQNNHYLVVENVDDSRMGTNNIQVLGTDVSGIFSYVVERSA